MSNEDTDYEELKEQFEWWTAKKETLKQELNFLHEQQQTCETMIGYLESRKASVKK